MMRPVPPGDATGSSATLDAEVRAASRERASEPLGWCERYRRGVEVGGRSGRARIWAPSVVVVAALAVGAVVVIKVSRGDEAASSYEVSTGGDVLRGPDVENNTGVSNND